MWPRDARPLLFLALAGLPACHPVSDVVLPAGRRGVAASSAASLCAILRASNDRALSQVPQTRAWHDADCAASGDGALGLLVQSVTAKPCGSDAEGLAHARWRLALARVYPSGAIEKIDGPPELDTLLTENSPCQAVESEERASLQAAADLDADGAPEVVLVDTSSGEESLDTWRASIWTVRGGKAERYRHDPHLATVMPDPHASALFRPQVRDVDGDGRPDFLHQGPYAAVDHPACGLFGTSLAVPAVFLIHARRDGSYVSDDKTAQAQIRSFCGAAAPAFPPAELRQHLGKDESLSKGAARYALCARVYGADPGELKQRMDRACPAWASDVDFYNLCGSSEVPEQTACPGWLGALIDIAPPLRLAEHVRRGGAL